MIISIDKAIELIQQADGVLGEEGQHVDVFFLDSTIAGDANDAFMRVEWKCEAWGDLAAVFYRSDNELVHLIGSSIFLREPEEEGLDAWQFTLLRMWKAEEELTEQPYESSIN